tara:strand:+ start:1820 stop:2056 length:237 start_codon:yes stop_codon:yes gene_type:complete
MQFKNIFLILSVITIIVAVLYFLISPYQNCYREVGRKIEVVRNKLATETDFKKRENFELEQEKLIQQIEFGCFERTKW